MRTHVLKTKFSDYFATDYRTNWPLLIFLFLLPLRNIQLKFFPPLPGGINFFNVMMVLSLIWAFRIGGEVEKTPFNRWIVFYQLWALVSVVVGMVYLSEVTGRIPRIKDELLIILLFFIVQKSVLDWGGFRRIVLAIVCSMPYIAKVTYNQYLSVVSYDYDDDLRIRGPLVDLGANELGALCVSVGLFALVFILILSDKRWKVLFVWIFIFSLVGVVYSYSRAGYLAFILGVIAITLYHKKRGKIFVVLSLVVILSFPFLPESVNQRFHMIEKDEATGKRDDSADSRFVLWQIAWEKYVEYPVFGIGYNSFKYINIYRKDAHNFYVLTLVERGTIGFIILLILLLKIFFYVRMRTKRLNEGEWATGISLAVLSMFLAILLGNMFGNRFSHHTIIWVFWASLGLLVVADRLKNVEDPVIINKE